MIVVDLFVQGLIQGSIYALIAVGLTLVYGLLRILHVAHAALFTLGGYMGVNITNSTGSLPLAIIVSMVTVGLFGMAFYWVVYRPILRQPPFVPLIASIGLFIALEEVFRLRYGALGRSFEVPPIEGTLAIADLTIKYAHIITFVASIVLIGALGLLAAKTRIGIAWRATVTVPEMAESFGVNIEKVRLINFFVGSALAALAGVMVAVDNNLIEPTSGAVPSYKALAIIVLGGLGSMRGTLIACFALGVLESYGTIYVGDFMDRDAIAFAFLILVLMLRPQGLFARS